jgi:spermidine synthase
MSHFDAVLIVAIVLAGLSALFVARAPGGLERRSLITAAAVAGMGSALLLLWQADNYTGRKGLVEYHGEKWRIEASYRSLFGNVKILKQEPDANGYAYRIYFQDGLTQNAVEMDGRSRSFYTYALEALAMAYHPEAKRALALGLGAGMTPARLAARGIHTETVEIDPASREAANKHFALDEKRTPVHQTDARTFVQRCPRGFDVIVVDLFHGDGTPDYLITRNFFRDLKHCIAQGGIAVFNTFADLQNPVSYAHLLVTLKSELPHLALFRPASLGASHTNSFIVAASQPLRAPAKVLMDSTPARHEGNLWDMLAAPVELTPSLLEGGIVITDARNRAALDIAHMQRVYRQSVIGFTPREFLLN